MYILSSSIKQDDPFVGNGTTKTPSNKYGSIEYNAFKPCTIEDGAIKELFDIIKREKVEYESNASIVQDALMKGLEQIKNTISSASCC